MSSAVDEQRATTDLRDSLATRVGEIYTDYTGQRPGSTQVIVQDDTVVAIVRDVLTSGERHLVHEGEDHLVDRVRTTFQRTMQEELISAVETLAKREVVGFMSGSSQEPDVSCEVFLLSPKA